MVATLINRLRRAYPEAPDRAVPDHPAIGAMTPAELADLPFPRPPRSRPPQLKEETPRAA